MKKGFTLIETLVTALIASFVLGGVVTFIYMSSQFTETIRQKTTAQNIMSSIVNQIDLEVKTCALVELTNDNKKLTVYKKSDKSVAVVYEIKQNNNDKWRIYRDDTDMTPFFPESSGMFENSEFSQKYPDGANLVGLNSVRLSLRLSMASNSGFVASMLPTQNLDFYTRPLREFQ